MPGRVERQDALKPLQARRGEEAHERLNDQHRQRIGQPVLLLALVEPAIVEAALDGAAGGATGRCARR